MISILIPRVRNLFVFLTVLSIVKVLGSDGSEKPCAARSITGESVVCVCSDSYCDNVIRHQPGTGQFVAYTSSQAGSRFNKTLGQLKSNEETKDCCEINLELEPETQYQYIEGFGGAVTDSAAINWKNLSASLQQSLIDSYFGDDGLQYSMLRVPIGGCDFSTRPYAYNELPENDTLLSNFTLVPEDYLYKIPMIKAILNTSRTPVHIVSTTWSPPTWMKTNDQYSGSSRLRPEFYQTYADYHYKFLQKYSEQGITIWGLTTTNEPTNGVIPLAKFNSLGWTASEMGKWIIENLGPTIRNSTFSRTKIITVDDQRYTIPYWFNLMIKKHPKVLDWIDGVGVHFYGDAITPASFLLMVAELHPDKFILATEASEGSFPWQDKVLIGSWARARSYINDIITDLNHSVIGWLDWNICLNDQGGPNWAENFVDSPIIVYPEKGEFIKQPMFYALGHFSKFIPRGSKRIEVLEKKPLISSHLMNVGVLTPFNTTVLVLYNDGRERSVRIKTGDRFAVMSLEPHSVTTIEINSD